MTRIIAGTARGRTLVVPRGELTRPTSDRVREALFSRLQHEGVLDGARVLDLYAGSGALGLEAASRGAAAVVLVESGRMAVQAARANVAALGLSGMTVVADRVERFLGRHPDSAFDVVFLDPPYALAEHALSAVLTLLVEGGWLPSGVTGSVVVERSVRSLEPTWPVGLVREDERRYGETRLWFAAGRPESVPRSGLGSGALDASCGFRAEGPQVAEDGE